MKRVTPRRRFQIGALLALISAVAVLGFYAIWFEPGRLHVGGRYVDQAGYVTTAQVWLDTGELRSGLTYPAYLREPGWRLYMPGHYVCLAASYAVFGRGVWQSLLPGWCAYVVGVVGMFVIGCRLFGVRRGAAAAALFGLFPGVLAYAHTAMAEPTFLAAGVVALAAFFHVPERRRALVVPLLLALPFLFRETGSLVVVPLALLAARDSAGRLSFVRAAAVLLGSVALLWLIQEWQFRTGKGSIPLTWITDGAFNYGNAFYQPRQLSTGEWSGAILSNCGRNLAELGRLAREETFQVGVVGFALIVAATLVCTLRGWKLRRSAPLPWVAGLLGWTILILVLFVYDVQGQKAMRTCLFTWPWLVLGLCTPGTRNLPVGRPVALALGAAALVLFHLTALNAAAELTDPDELVDDATARIEALNHDDETLLLVTPNLAALTLNYAVLHYPVPWSFAHTDRRTFQLLRRRHEIGTLIVPIRALGGQTPASLEDGLLRYVETFAIEGKGKFLVYQKP